MIVYNTKVVTSYGRVDVGEVQANDKLISLYGCRKVERIAYGGYKSVHEYKIYFDDISPIVLECDSEQRIYTDLGFVPIKCLGEGMKVTVRGQEDLKRVKFVIYDNGRTEDVYGVKLSEKKYYDEDKEEWLVEEGQFYANDLLIKSFV